MNYDRRYNGKHSASAEHKEDKDYINVRTAHYHYRNERANAVHYKPDNKQLEKFRQIQDLTEPAFEILCDGCRDCSKCAMALHRYRTTGTDAVCVYGMSETEFRNYMDDEDSEF